MQEPQPLEEDLTSSKPSTRLLDDILVEIVDVKGHVDDIHGSGYLPKRKIQSTASSSSSGQLTRRTSTDSLVTLEKDLKYEEGDVVELRSPEIERMALRATFAARYYPKNLTPATSTFRAVIQQDEDLRSNTALVHAMDAVCLTQIGSATENQSLVHSGLQRYQYSLIMFRRGLQRAIEGQYFDSNILATCHALMFSQRFTALGDGDEGSYMHMKGLAHMMYSRGLDSLTSEFDKLLLEDFQHYALRLGMVHRKPVHSALEKAWAKRVRSSAGPRFFPQMCSLAFHLPSLLEESDKACAEIKAASVKGKADACARAMKLMAGLSGLEATLQSWLQDWYSSMEQLPYRPVPARSFPFLQRFLTSEEMATFPTVLAFPSFASAVAHGRFWACLLLIRATSAELCLAVVPEEKPSAAQSHNVTECADDLCLSLAYLAGTDDNGLAGPTAVTGHLQLAFEWYEKIQDRSKMEWCKAIAQLVKMRGLSTPIFKT